MIGVAEVVLYPVVADEGIAVGHRPDTAALIGITIVVLNVDIRAVPVDVDAHRVEIHLLVPAAVDLVVHDVHAVRAQRHDAAFPLHQLRLVVNSRAVHEIAVDGAVRAAGDVNPHAADVVHHVFVDENVFVHGGIDIVVPFVHQPADGVDARSAQVVHGVALDVHVFQHPDGAGIPVLTRRRHFDAEGVFLHALRKNFVVEYVNIFKFSVSGVIVHQAQPRALRGIGRRPVHAHHFDFQIPYHEIAAIGDDDGIPRIPEEGSFPLPVRRKSDGIILRTGNICDREIAERVPAAEQNAVPRGKLRLKRLGVDRSQIERRGFAQSVVRGRAFGGYIKYPPRAQGIGRFLPFQLRFERILRIGGSVRHALVCRIFPRFFLSAACHSRTSAYRQNAQKYR